MTNANAIIVSYRIVSYRIVSYRIVSYRIVSYRIGSGIVFRALSGLFLQFHNELLPKARRSTPCFRFFCFLEEGGGSVLNSYSS